MYPVYLLVDVLYPHDTGGFTTDSAKLDYNLNAMRLSKSGLLQSAEGVAFPVFIYAAGRYVLIFQFGVGFVKPCMMFINHTVRIDEHFDVYADFYSPKTLQGIADTQRLIRTQGALMHQGVVLLAQMPPPSPGNA